MEIIPDGDWYCYECLSKVSIKFFEKCERKK